MKRTILCGLLAAMLAPALAVAGPKDRSHQWMSEMSNVRQGPDLFDCNAGGPESLLAGVAVVGLLCRRRR